MTDTKGQRKGSSTTGASTVADLIADPHNRRLHPSRNVTMITASLKAVGAARSIVLDEANAVLAGNGVLRGAPAAGISKVQIVDADGDTIIAVRRTGLTPEQKRQLALYDNRTAELAEWNIPQLEADLQSAQDLRPFFTDEELQRMKLVAKPAGDDVGDQVVPGSFLVVITCATEAEQITLLERFVAEGLPCKALVS